MMDTPSSALPRKKIMQVSILVACSLVVGTLGGRFIFNGSSTAPCVSDLHLIRSNLDCGVSEQKAQRLSSAEEKIKTFVNASIQDGTATRIGVFVRDMQTSRFMGVNDSVVFYMSSLLKTPLLIGGYKLAEVEPAILDQELEYTGVPNYYGDQIIKAEEELQVGNKYSIRELMRRAIVYSDNTAAQLLFDYYPPEFMDRILQALGIQFTRPTGEVENLTTPRTYANVFRTLYNASYLTKEYSNNALQILTEITYRNGATKKLPPEVVVAHKFSERTVYDSKKRATLLKQFHECGIVYANKGAEPYTFCIMTEGNDYGELQRIIQDISLQIYNLLIIGGGYK